MEQEDGTTQVLKKEASLDPLKKVWSPGAHAHARVGMQVGTQLDFGRVKVTAYVEYECDQDPRAVDETGALAFHKAFEFMTDGLSLLK